MIKEHRIVRPGAADYDELTAVWKASVLATHHFLTRECISFLEPLIRNKYLSCVDLYAVKTEEGKIRAFMGIGGTKIEMLFVHPDARGQGIGKRLIAYAVERLSVTEVDVNEQNEQAAGFYRHVGFEAIGRDALDGQGQPYPILHMRLKKDESY